ncbi:hypothetical protein QT17_01945 [Thermus sp. 2.9]|uniref:hypothetical protein n=1 Tax=Thermus sp. (strain 2.9) TaxID=1577051 RepID=UPI000543E9F4|nr:hypothetical protein [Thermus sp. 2.9]KHG66098.1 hypothetical protein QT17_01945 [Thermus sp. 2.9]
MRLALRLVEPSGKLAPCPESVVGRDGLFPLIYAQSYVLGQEGRVQVLEIPKGVAGDTLGTSTPRFRLEGTPGARPKRFQGRELDPVSLVLDLRRFVLYYFEERKRRTAQQKPLPEMVLDDWDRGLHWVVVPLGLPEVRQSAREPTRPYWTLELKGLRPAAQVPPRPEERLQAALFPETPHEVGARLQAALGGSVVPASYRKPAPLEASLLATPEPTPPSPKGAALLPRPNAPEEEAQTLAREAAGLAQALIQGEVPPEGAQGVMAALEEEAEALAQEATAQAVAQAQEEAATAQALAAVVAPEAQGFWEALEGFLARLEAALAQGEDLVQAAFRLAEDVAGAVEDPARLRAALDAMLQARLPQYARARGLVDRAWRLVERLDPGTPYGLLLAGVAVAHLTPVAPTLTRLRVGLAWGRQALPGVVA